MSATIHRPTEREKLEARCRRLMSEAARMPHRGWDDEREYAKKVAEIDGVLDQFNDKPRRS